MSDKVVSTVLGPIAPSALGFTTMHDHVMFDGRVMGRRMRPIIWDCKLPIPPDVPVALDNIAFLLNNCFLTDAAMLQDDEDELVQECIDFAATGAQSILEVSAVGIRCNCEHLRAISARSGLNIIASTGFYTSDSWPEQYQDWTVCQLHDFMLREATEGIAGTDILPGNVKIGLQSLTLQEERALRAAAQVCNETGLPLTIHPSNAAGGNRMEVIRILKEESFDISRLIFAHTRVEKYPATLRELLYHPELYQVDTTLARAVMDTGANCTFEVMNPCGFEAVGDYENGDIGRLAGIYDLIQSGYSGQMMLGNDVCGRSMLFRHGSMGYLRLTTFVIPTLCDIMGVSDQTIHTMMVDNPARLLAH